MARIIDYSEVINMSSEYDKNTGLPNSCEYLEQSLPEFLAISIKQMTDSWNKIDAGIFDINADMNWDELYSSINMAEVEQLITTDQAMYLRRKYLRAEKE